MITAKTSGLPYFSWRCMVAATCHVWVMAGNSTGPLFVWQQHTADCTSNCSSDNGVYVLWLHKARQNGHTNKKGSGQRQAEMALIHLLKSIQRIVVGEHWFFFLLNTCIHFLFLVCTCSSRNFWTFLQPTEVAPKRRGNHFAPSRLLKFSTPYIVKTTAHMAVNSRPFCDCYAEDFLHVSDFIIKTAEQECP